MRKIISALAVVAAASFGTIALTIGTASAHDATLGYDCFTVTSQYTNFSAGANTATITINGVVHDVSFTGPNGSATVPFVSHSGDPAVKVSTTFISGDGQPKTVSASFPADSCAPTTTTTTAGPSVGPETVVRPTVVAAEAVVASPVFTG